MSLLTPLYVLGLLAVSLPVVFHLIRRMPKGEFTFSSLMFLSASPPRLTRRSRLEHLLLLLLRAVVLGLLAFAFARPFLRQPVSVDAGDGPSRRLAVVVDTSASMRRDDLWQQAVAQVQAVMRTSRPLDQVALFTCDDALRPLVSFEEMSEIPPAQRARVVARRLAAAGPTWFGTQLGQALIDAVEIVNSVPGASGKATPGEARIVLVTDLQQGSRLDVLAGYPWPDGVRLELRPVKLQRPTNAGVHGLADRTRAGAGDSPSGLRVRVLNDASSVVDQFALSWLGPDDRPLGTPTQVYVPAGESRVVRVRRPDGADAAAKLRLTGDGCEFDNTLYFAFRPEVERSVVYLGDDTADDVQQPRYYLQRALSDGLSPPVELVAPQPEEPLNVSSPATTPLVVVTRELTQPSGEELRDFAEAGGTVLFVLRENQPAPAVLKALLGAPGLEVTEAHVDEYAMLGEIAFDHPLLAAMSGPHFNDFTQIHFWKYRRIHGDRLEGAAIVARFENGDPAVVEQRIGRGRVVVLASGWHPSDSQWARSWKFVLLVAALVGGGGTANADRDFYTVGEAVPLGEEARRPGERVVVKPSGEQVLLAAGSRRFTDTQEPGWYSIESSGRVSPKLENGRRGDTDLRGDDATVQDTRRRFAVNLDPVESRTSPLAVETLEQLGCRLVSPSSVAENHQRERQLRDTQLEGRQKLWQWLVAAALGVLIVETWLAGRTAATSLAKAGTA